MVPRLVRRCIRSQVRFRLGRIGFYLGSRCQVCGRGSGSQCFRCCVHSACMDYSGSFIYHVGVGVVGGLNDLDVECESVCAFVDAGLYPG